MIYIYIIAGCTLVTALSAGLIAYSNIGSRYKAAILVAVFTGSGVGFWIGCALSLVYFIFNVSKHIYS